MKMGFRTFSLAAVPLLFSGFVAAVLPDGRAHGNIMPHPTIPKVLMPEFIAPVVSRNGTQLPPYNTTYYFDQLIDHKNPSLGTFKQRFWHTWEYYEPGGPVILMTPGEGNADGFDGYLTTRSINGLIAQQQNGTTIVIEHRFYGLSNPRPDLSDESLKLHTLQQAIDDLVYFAKNVNLPMPGGDQLTPDKAPWILIGGSYSGALTSWTMVNKPGVFFAGYASSGVVQAILNFWEYFEPIRAYMPANCSADVQAVITHIDKVFLGKNQTAINEIKDSFGLSAVSHLDDVAGALRNNIWDWQSLQPTSGPNSKFYAFCDALEVKDGVSAPASGWGLAYALSAWAAYFKNTYYTSLCGSVDPETCLGTYDRNATFYTDLSVNNAWRSWFWIVCNEVGYLQEGAPEIWQPTLVTRLVEPPYDLRQCSYMYPKAFPKAPSVIQAESWIAKTNVMYKGWNVKVDRLFFANGERDPWKDSTVSATHHTVQSTPRQPIALSDGFHCTDLGAESIIDPTVAAVQKQALATFKEWLTEWKPASNSPAPHRPAVATSAKLVAPDASEVKPINAFSKDAGTF